MTKLPIVLLAAVLIASTGCEKQPVSETNPSQTETTQSATKEIGYGIIENEIYKNDYFNMSINVPKDWSVQTQAQQKEIMEVGTNLLSGEDDSFKNSLKESQKQSVNLFSFSKYELGAAVDFNPSLNSVAERVSHAPGVKRGSDYNYHVKKLLKAGAMAYEFPAEGYSREVSGIVFDVMPAQISINGMTVYQEYYAAKFNDYILAIILTHSSNAELKELESHLNSLQVSR